jgi:hypothetical protein
LEIIGRNVVGSVSLESMKRLPELPDRLLQMFHIWEMIHTIIMGRSLLPSQFP